MSRLYAAMITQYKERGIVEARTLIDRIQDSAFISLVTEIASTEWQAEQIEPETQRFVRLFADEKMKRVRDRLKKELAEAESEADHQRAERILAELRNYGLDVKSDQN